jgi:hypothetical protein
LLTGEARQRSWPADGTFDIATYMKDAEQTRE